MGLYYIQLHLVELATPLYDLVEVFLVQRQTDTHTTNIIIPQDFTNSSEKRVRKRERQKQTERKRDK